MLKLLLKSFFTINGNLRWYKHICIHFASANFRYWQTKNISIPYWREFFSRMAIYYQTFLPLKVSRKYYLTFRCQFIEEVGTTDCRYIHLPDYKMIFTAAFVCKFNHWNNSMQRRENSLCFHLAYKYPQVFIHLSL